nr:hypothetical protein [Burkholderiaceae bacterium]
MASPLANPQTGSTSFTRRRRLLQVGALGALAGASGSPLLGSAQAATDDVGALLRRGGVVVAFRHALAPGTFDPP